MNLRRGLLWALGVAATATALGAPLWGALLAGGVTGCLTL